MYFTGNITELVGTIVTTKQNGEALNVILAVSEGIKDKRHNVYYNCSFWGNDIQSVSKYPVGHLMFVVGTGTAEAYIDSKTHEPKVKHYLNVMGWRSLQRLDKPELVNESQWANTQQITPRKQMSKEDELLKKSLEAVITFGPYKTFKIKEVLKKDAKYVYSMAKDCPNKSWKEAFSRAYKHFYDCEMKNKAMSNEPRRVNGDLPFD